MKPLIVHPKDETTKFLTGIYATLTSKTVITGGITKAELQKHIDSHDQVIMLGHGSPIELLSVNQFPDCGSYVIDGSMVESLRKKSNNIFIWCHADQFVHSLQGFFSGMLSARPGRLGIMIFGMLSRTVLMNQVLDSQRLYPIILAKG
ncbi:MAG: hypothetical protein Q7U54_09585 [Bacteroidales bacterium]|nr:hypothetical protein [Bacteroidales bacterium]